MRVRLKPTEEQSEIVKCLPAPGEIILVNAYAGTGKTSTLKMIAEANAESRILYICYNRSTAEKASRTFPKNVKCKTIHSLAYGEIGRHYYHKLGNPTTRDVMLAFNVEKSYIAVLALKLVERYCYSTQREISLEILSEEDGGDLDILLGIKLYPEALPLAHKVWNAMIDRDSPFQITHDGYLKLWSFRQPALPFRLLMLDEAQDTNPVTLEIVLSQSRKKRAGLVLVGDTHQSIYQWRKAVNAMLIMRDQASYRFPLTSSFRFNQTIADNASKLLGYLSDPVHLRGLGPTKDILPKNVVIGRKNASIIHTAFAEVLGRRGKVHFAGTEPGKNWDPFYLYEIQILLDLHYLKNGQLEKIETLQIRQFKSFEEVVTQRDGDERGIGKDDQLYSWVSLLEALEQMAELETDGDVTQAIQLLRDNSTSPTEASLSVSTAHRAKGLEWQSVTVLGDFINGTIPPRYPAEFYTEERHEFIAKGRKIPSRYDGGIDSEMRETINPIYVAVTRAARQLDHAWLDQWLSTRSIGQVYDAPPPPEQSNVASPSSTKRG